MWNQEIIRGATVSFKRLNSKGKVNTEEPYDGSLYNEVLGITNDFLYLVILNCKKKNLVKANKFRQSVGPSLYWGSTVIEFGHVKQIDVDLFLRDIDFLFFSFLLLFQELFPIE